MEAAAAKAREWIAPHALTGPTRMEQWKGEAWYGAGAGQGGGHVCYERFLISSLRVSDRELACADSTKVLRCAREMCVHSPRATDAGTWLVYRGTKRGVDVWVEGRLNMLSVPRVCGFFLFLYIVLFITLEYAIQILLECREWY